MASQSGTRYEDRTMQRPGGNTAASGGQASTNSASSHHMNNSSGGYGVRVCICWKSCLCNCDKKVRQQLLLIKSCNACYFSTTGRRSANGKPFPVQFGAAKRLRSKSYGKWNLAYCFHCTKNWYSLLLQVSYTGGCKTLFNKMLYSLRSFYQIARKQLLISTRYPAIAPHLLKGAFLLVATCLYLVSSILHVYCIKCL